MSSFNNRHLVKKFSEMEEVCTLTNGEIEHLESMGLISSYEVTQDMIDEGTFEPHHLGGTTGNLTPAGRTLMEQRSVEELESLLVGTTVAPWNAELPSGSMDGYVHSKGEGLKFVATLSLRDNDTPANLKLIAASPDVTRQCILVTKERDDMLALIQDIYDDLHKDKHHMGREHSIMMKLRNFVLTGDAND